MSAMDLVMMREGLSWLKIVPLSLLNFSESSGMSSGDEAIYERILKVISQSPEKFLIIIFQIENKDVFVDLKSNQNGVYLKISERNGNNRNSVLIPASGIKRLGEVIQEISQSAEFKQITQQFVGEKGVR
jgi:hypothetical protein